ncbi:ADAMTS-like protein 1 isoform X2 [Lytechinus variegatus]|uniref:ADAMTS-like protein 1 isoform X2 n=1 Tax=Lytechinus variegatus TaxID=7654 RepID=UPI001BB19873|nr:ADAMTS-like protein 1 isoform X2 [Lytechinus variegatus]
MGRICWICVFLGLQIIFVNGAFTDYKALSSQVDDDDWTEWSRWSECSRTCGGGASYQTRQCNTGHSCTGRNIRYKTCNTQECLGEELDFRSQQCAAYNDEKYENRTIEWEPVESSSLQEMCSLVCRVKHHNFTKMLAPKVLDGTRCNRYSVDMCIAGKCEPVGCDHEFNSTATFDRCKVCNGDNTTCQLMKGRRVVDARDTGLQDVMLIPTGSHTIKLSSKDLGSTLGLHEIDETKGLNQAAGPAEDTLYPIAGTVAYYRRFRSGREQILIDQIIKRDLVVTVYLSDSRRSREKLHYQYLYPLTHVWKNRGWSACSASCGGGQQSSVLDCTNVATGETVEDSRCEGQKPEVNARGCNNVNCPPRWEGEPWGACTVSCGSGTQTRDIYCIQKISTSMTVRLSDDMCDGSRLASVQACNVDPCPYWKPEPWSPCSVTCGQGMSTREIMCRNHRNELAMGCDVDTMPSIRTVCLPGIPCLPDPDTNTPEVNRPELATTSPLEKKETAEVPRYYTGEWSPCSTSCGPGTRTRSVRCKVYLQAFSSTFDISDLDCQGSPRPHDVEECQDTECTPPQGASLFGPSRSSVPVHTDPTEPNVVQPDPTLELGPRPDVDIFIWRYWGYSPCSASCVGGVQESIVRCVNAFTDELVSDAHCDYSLKLPTSQQSCNERPCPPEWKVFLYGECSSSCGQGVKYPTDIYCIQKASRNSGVSVNILTKEHCTGPKPNNSLPCEATCPATWVLGDWSECSATCGYGAGNKTRSVSCQQTIPTGGDIEVDITSCPLPVPHTVEECDNVQCPPYWIARASSPCSQSCGTGVQSVSLTCHQMTPVGEEIELDSQLCPIPPPPDTQPCNEIDCPVQWTIQTLSQCSASCGAGIQLRSVLCGRILANGTQVYIDQRHCMPDRRPADHVTCHLAKCTDIEILSNRSTFYQTGLVSKVRLVIGQEAYVYESTVVTIKCPVVNFKKSQLIWERGLSPIEDTDPRIKVVSGGILRIKYVEERDSGVYACRAGDQRETITLHVRSGLPTYEKSSDQALPNSTSNDDIRWHLGSWSECSASCNGGWQTREVRCLRNNLVGRSKPRDAGICKSVGLEEPITRKECNKHPCQNHWVAGIWSQCTGECVGVRRSLQTRGVLCRSASLDILTDERCPVASKPLHERLCINDECRPKWLVTKWSSCSSSCGVNAVQRRKVRCVTSETRVRMESSICAAVFGQPHIMKKCLLDPCPNETY